MFLSPGGIYVQEPDASPPSVAALVCLVNNHPGQFPMGFAYGHISDKVRGMSWAVPHGLCLRPHQRQGEGHELGSSQWAEICDLRSEIQALVPKPCFPKQGFPFRSISLRLRSPSLSLPAPSLSLCQGFGEENRSLSGTQP